MSENEKKAQLDPADSAKEVKSKKADKPEEKKSKPSIFKRIGKWFKEMKSELKKVQWPSARSVLNNTVTVLICVLIVGIFIWLFDALASAVIGALLALAGKA